MHIVTKLGIFLFFCPLLVSNKAHSTEHSNNWSQVQIDKYGFSQAYFYQHQHKKKLVANWQNYLESLPKQQSLKEIQKSMCMQKNTSCKNDYIYQTIKDKKNNKDIM